MRIAYRILWIDDKIEDFIADKVDRELKEFIEDLGFHAELSTCSSGEEFEKLITEKYDLIITDYNLAEELEGIHYGDEVVKRVREAEIFTEVLIYSSASNDFSAITEKLKNAERISKHAGKPGLLDKIKKTISLTVTKVQEVNNVRGLLMAETSDMDNLMRDILKEFFGSGSSVDKKNKLKEDICKKIKDSIDSNSKKLQKLCEENKINEVIDHPVFDSAKKARTINSLVQILGQESLQGLSNFFNEYNDEVLTKRNSFGHVSEKLVNGAIVLESHVPGKPVEIFDEENCKAIRKALIKHKKNLQLIRLHATV
jgi:CheY-like chemotaxis protein